MLKSWGNSNTFSSHRKPESEHELREAIERLMQETDYAQRAALSSGESFVIFLRDAGLYAIAQKIGEALVTAWDWVVDILGDLADFIFA